MYPSSCADILDAGASLGDGVYTIAPSSDASPYQVFCNMTLAGGGWTNFFYGLNGSPYVFAHFEQTAVDCPDPSSQCLRRIPPEVSVSSVLATCGSAAVTFVPGAGVLAYLHNGTQGDWEPNSNVTSVDGNVDTAFASHMYIGKSDGNLGWILSATPDDSHNMIPSTFSNSYNLNSDWDYCNGVATIGEPVTLSYR